MSNRILILFITAISVIAFGCKSRKPKASCSTHLNKYPKGVVDSLKKYEVDFSDVVINSKVSYSDGSNSQSMIMNIQMRKDSFIWVSVNVLLEVARIYVTPDSFTVLDRINRCYITKPISEIKDFVGQELTLRQMQNLLLANSVFPADSFEKKDGRDAYDFLNQSQSDIQNNMFLTQCFRPYQTDFNRPLQNQKVDIKYQEYHQTELGLLPKLFEASMNISGATHQVVVEFNEVSKTDLSALKFTVSSKYARCK
ncbi:MAG: DUF4292 domain-containing protein [Flavobacteriales bacterium]|nr:DUF4292 domain-containing protein [Flavobacteriales bacterium]